MPGNGNLTPIEQRLRRIQQALGVHADGLLGSETLSALETRLEITPPTRAVSLEASSKSLALIVEFEVTSKAVYERKFRRPVWPGGMSGVTIGIGYDIGVTTKTQLRADWQGWIADTHLLRLLTAQGITGPNAKQLTRSLSDVDIPFDVAQMVFYQTTLPRFAKLTRATYPGVQHLPADAQGALLSLIYNRGAALSGASRTEMAAIKPLIAGGNANLAKIAAQIEAMARLWPTLRGLQRRRQREAALVREADRSYRSDEVISV